MLRSKMSVAAALAITAGSTVLAQDASTITLSSGETMNVTVLERGADSVLVEHPLLGELSIPADALTTVNGEPYEPPPVEQIAAQPEEEAAASADAPVWNSSFELGLSGSEGNTENLNFRTAFRTERVIEDVERFSFLSRYKIKTDNGDRSENEWYNSALQEWFLQEHPRWSIFVQGDLEYDEFQDWDVRASIFAGAGYVFIDEDDTKLRGRLGAGGSYEWGGADEEFTPEALLGYDFEHQLNDRSRVVSTGNLYPSLSDGGEFRSYFDAAYEIDMTDDKAWSLRIGMDHKYDSQSNARNWDLSYYAAVVTKF